MYHAQMPEPLPPPEFTPLQEPPATTPPPIEDPAPGTSIPEPPTPEYVRGVFPPAE
jgi:hypothetical protein